MAETALREEPQDAALDPLPSAYVHHRRLLFAIAVGFILICFNGQWIVERDTSIYRGLGHALATGQGYTFGEFGSSVTYPGLPLILAGLEVTFGETALPAILLINLMALATLLVTYRLMRLHFPQWVAVAITVGVGINARFVQAAQEIMTDVPFLLGVMLFLYGWERLAIRMTDEGGRMKSEGDAPHSSVSRHPSSLLAPLAYLTGGLILALSMRPTFWILAMAWGLVCLWGLVRGPRRLYLTCLVLVVGVALVWFVLDPRTRGFNPLGGGYEQQFLERLGRTGATLRRNVPDLLRRQLSEGFFNGRFGSVITPAVALALIGSTWFLFRRGLLLWGLLILCTIGVTLLIEVVPRYYLMVLPVLMAAYVLAFRALASWAGPKWGPAVFTAGVVLLVIPNVVRVASFVYDQHWNDPGRRSQWQRSIVSSELVKSHVPEGARVLAPGATIVSYLSGREALMAREIFPARVDPVHYPQYLADKGVEYAIWPPNKIRDQEGVIAEMMDRGVIVPTDVLARASGMALAKIEVVVPPEGEDWRANPVSDYEWVTTRQGPTEDEATRQKRRQAMEARRRRAAAEARERRARIELRERYEKRLAREARERQAAKARRLKRLRREQAAAHAAATREAATQEAATRPGGATQPSRQPLTPPPASMPTQPSPATAPVSIRPDGGCVFLACAFCPHNPQRLSPLPGVWRGGGVALRDRPCFRSMATPRPT